MDWLWLKILVAWVAIKILLIFFLKLVIALQLITTEKFGYSNGDWNSIETSFFSIATLWPWCGLMATKNLDCLGGNQNLVNTSFFFDWRTPTRVWIVVTKIRSTLFHHKLSFFDRCIATKVWTSCDWNLVNNFPPWNVFQFYFFWSLHYDQGVDWLQLKILVTWVAIEIWLTFHHFFQNFFLIISLQLGCGPVVIEILGRLNGIQATKTWKTPSNPFFWGCYIMLGCGLIVTLIISVAIEIQWTLFHNWIFFNH